MTSPPMPPQRGSRVSFSSTRIDMRHPQRRRSSSDSEIRSSIHSSPHHNMATPPIVHYVLTSTESFPVMRTDSPVPMSLALRVPAPLTISNLNLTDLSSDTPHAGLSENRPPSPLSDVAERSEVPTINMTEATPVSPRAPYMNHVPEPHSAGYIIPASRQRSTQEPTESASLRSGYDRNIWSTYAEEAGHYDAKLVEGWQRSMDVLLLFAALFSAILTAFLVESNKSLNEDYGKTAVFFLASIAQKMNVSDDSQEIAAHINSLSGAFKPSHQDCLINRLWFTALGLSLAAAVLSMLAKQWVYEYLWEMSPTTNGSRHRVQNQARLRQYRYEGLRRWHIAEIVACLPLMLHLSVLLFAVGLIKYLWSMDVITSIILTTITAGMAAIYCITTILPSYKTDCAYKTPASHFVSYIRKALWSSMHVLMDHLTHSEGRYSIAKGLKQAFKVGRVLLDAEKAEVEARENELDQKGLEWLRETTRSMTNELAAQQALNEIRGHPA